MTQAAEPGAGVLIEGELDATRPTIVAIGGLMEEVGMPPFEFFRLLGSWPVNRIFVRDLERAFYQGGVEGLGRWVTEIATELKAKVPDPDRTLLVGTSAGGYLALAVSGVSGMSALAVSPVCTLRLLDKIRLRDRRWERNYMRKTRRLGRPHPEQLSLRTFLQQQPHADADVYYGGRHRIDSGHVDLIRQVPGDLRFHPIDSDRHDCIREMRDSGELVRVMRELLGA